MIKMKLEPAYGIITSQNVDRMNDTLHDVVVMIGNAEALGHGIMTDMKTLHMAAQLGNENPRGVPSRFGHPGMSENTLGKKVGFSRHFQVRGDKLYADIKMMAAARKSPVFTQDPLEYLYQVAEQNPQDMGMSVVIDTDLVWIMPDGSEESALDEYGFINDERPDNALNELPIMRPMFFYFNDFVAEGALTHDGLFSQRERLFSDSTGSGYAETAFEFLDLWREKFGIPLSQVPQKADSLIQFYLKARRKQDMTVKRKKLNEDISDLDQAILELDETAVITDTEIAEPETAEPTPDLDQTLETAEETAEELTEQPEVTPSSDIEKELEVLRAEYTALQADMEKLKKLVTVLVSNDQVLTRRLKRLETEPMVAEKVPTIPTPSKSLASQRPQSTFERSNTPGSAITGQTSKSPLTASIERAAKRTRQHPGVSK